jgi:hypothetical protein
MSVNINDFKIYTEDILVNKNQSGNTITPAQFNIAANRAQMIPFEEDRLIFLKTGESSDFLDWFLRNTIVNPDKYTGYVAYPKDFQHTADVRSYYKGRERKVALVANSAWGDVQQSELMVPSLYFPKYTEFANEYRFLPRNIGTVMLDYWKEPQKPVWAYTIVSNVPTYDPIKSVDFEFPSFALERVAEAYLSIIAQNLKDPQLAQFADIKGKENKSIV